MIEQVFQTLAVVREHTDPAAAWKELVDVCRRVHPLCPWNDLPSPDFAADVELAVPWLNRHLRQYPEASGVYLGLDTLNMRGGRGTNIEIGSSSECDSNLDSPDWVWDAVLDYGPSHLLRGLVKSQEVYSRPAWAPAFNLCNYVFFLGYAGIVLTQAMAELTFPTTMMLVWGFHDGDLFTLGRYRQGSFTKLCAE